MTLSVAAMRGAKGKASSRADESGDRRWVSEVEEELAMMSCGGWRLDSGGTTEYSLPCSGSDGTAGDRYSAPLAGAGVIRLLPYVVAEGYLLLGASNSCVSGTSGAVDTSSSGYKSRLSSLDCAPSTQWPNPWLKVAHSV